MAEPDLDKLNFYSRVNYMKRSVHCGNDPIETDDVEVEHNLGYAPQFTYYSTLDDNEFLWYGGEQVFEGTDSTAFFPTPPPLVDGWTTTSVLTLHPSSFTTERDVYWLIYLDYGE